MNANTKWISDPEHSQLGFKIKHLMISSVTGKFNQFEVRSETTGTDFENGQIRLTAKADSLSTDNQKRDQHLASSDFFETATFPELEFSSTKLEKTGQKSFNLYGLLTIKGITNKVIFTMEQSNMVKDLWGGQRIALKVIGKINRIDWGLDFNMSLETGGLMLGETVNLESEVQMVKQPVEKQWTTNLV